MLPKLRIYQEMMEKIYLELQLAVFKGSHRVQRPLLNINSMDEATGNIARDFDGYDCDPDSEDERFRSHDLQIRKMGKCAYSWARRHSQGIVFDRTFSRYYYQSHQYAVEKGNLFAVGNVDEICRDLGPIGCSRSGMPTYGQDIDSLRIMEDCLWIWMRHDLWLSIDRSPFRWEGRRFKDDGGVLQFVPACPR